MITVIGKKLGPEDIRRMLRRKGRKNKKRISSFFGKLPNIEDGLKYQKKIRNEWK